MARMMKTVPVADVGLRERLQERSRLMAKKFGTMEGNPWTAQLDAIAAGRTIVVSGYELRGVPDTELGGHYEVDAHGVVTVAEIDRTF
jgi:hypothetical protein